MLAVEKVGEMTGELAKAKEAKAEVLVVLCQGKHQR
jgi:hypothetical protein